MENLKKFSEKKKEFNEHLLTTKQRRDNLLVQNVNE